MKNLLYKELKLSVHSTNFLFLPLAAMLLIPNYPYYVAYFYETLGIFFTFLSGNATNDVFFTTLLPIRKRDAVTARFFTVILFEMLMMVVSIPFIILRYTVLQGQNLAGMDANVALMGLALMMFGIFNLVFLPMFYKTAYKTGAPYLVSCVAMTLFAAAAEVIIHLVPGLKNMLDNTDKAFLPQHFAVLCLGILLYILMTLISHQISVNRFEKLDL